MSEQRSRPTMPEGLTYVRTTPEFDAATLPVGLQRRHRVAAGTWGRVRVLEGSVLFVFEDDDPAHGASGSHELVAGDSIDVPPGVAHHVEPRPGCRLAVEFWAPTGGGGN